MKHIAEFLCHHPHRLDESVTQIDIFPGKHSVVVRVIQAVKPITLYEA